MTGFKQAEIGTLPEDWEIKHIENIILASVGGGTPSTKVKAYWDGDIHWTTSKRLSDKLYLMDGEKRISNQALESTSTKLVPSENVIVSTRVTVGKAMVNKIDIAISQDLTGLLIDKQHYLPEFVAYQLKTEQIQSIFESQKRGATIKGITREDLENIPLLCPPFSEQGKIVRVLWLIQSAIETQEKTIQTTTELKKALMQKLFTEGLRGEPQKETEIGLVPKSWEIKRVGDFCDVRSSSILFKDINKIKAQKETPIKVLALKVSDMNLAGNEDDVKSSQIEFYLENEDNNIKKLIPPLALIFPKRGAAISTNKKRITLHYSILDPNLMALLPTNKCNPNFLYLYFQRLDLRTISDKGLIPQLNKKDLMPVLVPMPSVDEQEEVVLTIKRIDAKIHINTDKLKTLQSLFKSMLHHLMTGQIRVKNLRFS